MKKESLRWLLLTVFLVPLFVHPIHAPAPYNMTNITASNNLAEIFVYTGSNLTATVDQPRGYLGIFILIAVFAIFFVVFLPSGTKEAYVGATWMLLLSSMFLGWLQMVSTFSVVVSITMFSVGIAILILSRFR